MGYGHQEEEELLIEGEYFMLLTLCLNISNSFEKLMYPMII